MKKTKNSYDVIIIGAGAAGIACAERLSASKKSVLILEARDRIGGRIDTYRGKSDPLLSFPSVELGAEFIHGADSVNLERLRKWNLNFYDAGDNHLFLKGRKLQEFPDYFERLGKIMTPLRITGKDRSVFDFIRSAKVSPQLRPVFNAFVEGFHAVDTRLIGEQSLAATEETTDKELNGSAQFRPLFPYIELIKKMFDQCKGADLRLNQVVKEVQWKKHQVEVSVQSKKYRARQLVVTAPLGVLKLSKSRKGSIYFSPRPSLLDELSDLNMGHVQKLIFEFKSRFWESLSADPVVFLHTDTGNDFPTWWTLHPLRTPYLVAWQGGPKAEEMASWTKSKIQAAALRTLSKFTKRSTAFLRAQTKACYTHNWSADPFFRGAYGYVGVDGLSRARKLGIPTEDTIFWAGEAFQSDSSRATVHGAIRSGKKAAEDILKSY